MKDTISKLSTITHKRQAECQMILDYRIVVDPEESDTLIQDVIDKYILEIDALDRIITLLYSELAKEQLKHFGYSNED